MPRLLWRDTRESYGRVSRWLHWLMAVAIVALFALGVWMRGLDYMSPYYNLAPDIHRSAGMLVLCALVFRFGWRLVNVKPDDRKLSRTESAASWLVHWGFYPLLLVIMVSGYLISTANGQPVSVFGWFSVPSVVARPGLETAAGTVHAWTAYATMALAALHTAAALKHHFVDRSDVLARMWRGPPAV